jgi:hypothetical protein
VNDVLDADVVLQLNPGGDTGKARVPLMVGAARRRLGRQIVKEKLA